VTEGRGALGARKEGRGLKEGWVERERGKSKDSRKEFLDGMRLKERKEGG